jgi:hypothetical protein
MAQITDNIAAWLPEEKAGALEVGPGPKPTPAENEVVIKVAYAAVNPTDWKVWLPIAHSEVDINSSMCADAGQPLLQNGLSHYSWHRCRRHDRAARFWSHSIQDRSTSDRTL